jgi:hypothetical protein
MRGRGRGSSVFGLALLSHELDIRRRDFSHFFFPFYRTPFEILR